MTPAERRARARPGWAWSLGTLAIIATTLAVLHVTNPYVGFFYSWWESPFYVGTAEHPLRQPISPYYGYRLLPPLLVRLLPFPTRLGFTIVDYLSLLAAAYWLAVILVHERVDSRLAIVAAVLFLTFPCSTKWLLAFSAGPDAFYLAVISLIYRCIQLRRWGAMAVLLIAGMFTKVSVGVLWVAAVLSGPWHLGRETLARIGSIVPGLFALIAVQILWPAADPASASFPGNPLAGVFVHLEKVIHHVHLKLFETTRMWPLVLPQAVEFPMSFFIVFGMVAIILAWHLRESARILARNPAMLVVFCGTMLASFVGSFDGERCQMYAAVPVLYTFSKLVQADWSFYGRWRIALPLIAMQMYFSALFTNARYYRRYMSHYMAPAIALRYLVAWLCAAAVLALLARAFPSPSGPQELRQD